MIFDCDRPDCLFPDCLCTEPPPKGSNTMRTIWKLIAVVAFFVAVWLAVSHFLFITGARAHEAQSVAAGPLGWKYPWACCSNQDCERSTAASRSGEIEEVADGFLITKTGEVVPYDDKRVKDSPDGDFHWCAHVQGLDKNKTLCLFRPPRGF